MTYKTTLPNGVEVFVKKDTGISDFFESLTNSLVFIHPFNDDLPSDDDKVRVWDGFIDEGDKLLGFISGR